MTELVSAKVFATSSKVPTGSAIGKPRRLSVAQGFCEIENAAQGLGTERVAVTMALGRYTSAVVHAALDVPRFDVSAMDGFAVFSGDVIGASATHLVTLRVEQVIPAGSAGMTVGRGSAAAISTGAPIPPGADGVIPVEACGMDGTGVVISRTVAPGLNIRRRGEDGRVGSVLVPAGTRIGSDTIGALRAFGIDEVGVYKRPSLALFSTGNELFEGAGNVSARIADSNGPMIAAAMAELGLQCHDQGPVADTPAAIDAAIRAALASPAQIVVSTGGVSAGAFDFVRAGVERAGGKIVFHGLQMRPGKPLLFAVMDDGRLFFGLPGNPVAAAVGFRFFVQAAIRRLMGLEAEEGVRVQAGDLARADMTLFLRCRGQEIANGVVAAN